MNQLKKVITMRNVLCNGKKNPAEPWVAIFYSFSSKYPNKSMANQTSKDEERLFNMTWYDDLGELPIKGPNFLNTLTKPIQRRRYFLVTCHSFSTEKKISQFQHKSNSLHYMSSKSL